MAALAPIAIADSVPVTRTFNPVKIDSAGVAILTDRSGGIAVGFPTATISLKMPSKASRNYRVMGKLVYPVLEATSPSTSTGIQPAPTKAYELIGTFEFVLPERSSSLDRNNVLALTRNFLANINITNAVASFESLY